MTTRAQRLVVHLADEELEEAFELVRVAAQARSQSRRIDALGRLERPHLDLELVAEPLDAAEHAHRVARCRTARRACRRRSRRARGSGRSHPRARARDSSSRSACAAAPCVPPRRSPSTVRFSSSSAMVVTEGVSHGGVTGHRASMVVALRQNPRFDVRWSARVLWRVTVVGLGLLASRSPRSLQQTPRAWIRGRPSSRARAGRAVARRRGWYGQCRGSRTAVPRAPLRPGCRRPARVARRAAVRRHRARSSESSSRDAARTTSST